MRFALALAASAALWVQPAQAATYFWVGDCCLLDPVLISLEVHDATPGAAIVALRGSRGPNTAAIDAHLGYADETGFFSLTEPFKFVAANGYGYFSTRIAALDPNDLSKYDNRWQIGSISNVAFSGHPAPAAPEPSTWALMLLGFGAVGSTLRRTNKAKLRLA